MVWGTDFASPEEWLKQAAAIANDGKESKSMLLEVPRGNERLPQARTTRGPSCIPTKFPLGFPVQACLNDGMSDSIASPVKDSFGGCLGQGLNAHSGAPAGTLWGGGALVGPSLRSLQATVGDPLHKIKRVRSRKALPRTVWMNLAGSPSYALPGDLTLPHAEDTQGAPISDILGVSMGLLRSTTESFAMIHSVPASMGALDGSMLGHLLSHMRPQKGERASAVMNYPVAPPGLSSTVCSLSHQQSAIKKASDLRELPHGEVTLCPREPSFAKTLKNAPRQGPKSDDPNKPWGHSPPGLMVDVDKSSQGIKAELGPSASIPFPCDCVEPLPPSFLEDIGLDVPLSKEETAAYEAAVKSNCLLWLPLGRRRVPLVPGLVVYSYLQSLSVASQCIVCLSPTGMGTFELYEGLCKVLSLVCPQEAYNGGLYGSYGDSAEEPRGLIASLCAQNENGEIAAQSQRCRHWQQTRLKVKWGSPHTWNSYRAALKEYSEALRKHYGLHWPPRSSQEKQNYNLHRPLAPLRFARSQADAVKIRCRTPQGAPWASPPVVSMGQPSQDSVLHAGRSIKDSTEGPLDAGSPGALTKLRGLLHRIRCPSLLLAEPLRTVGEPLDVKLVRYSSEQPSYKTKSEVKAAAKAIVEVQDSAADPMLCLQEAPRQRHFTEAIRHILSMCDEYLTAALRVRCPLKRGATEASYVDLGLKGLGADNAGGSPDDEPECFHKPIQASVSTSLPQSSLNGAGSSSSSVPSQYPPYASGDPEMDAVMNTVVSHPLLKANVLCMRSVSSYLSPKQRQSVSARWGRLRRTLLHIQQEWGFWCLCAAAQRIRMRLNRIALSLSGIIMYSQTNAGRNNTGIHGSPLELDCLVAPEHYNGASQVASTPGPLEAQQLRAATEGSYGFQAPLFANGMTPYKAFEKGTLGTHQGDCSGVDFSLPPWLLWPFGVLPGECRLLEFVGLCKGLSGALKRPDPYLMQRRLELGASLLFLELLGAFLRQPSLSPYRKFCQGGLQDLGGLLHFHHHQQQQDMVMKQDRVIGFANCYRALAKETIRGLFSQRLIALDRILCQLQRDQEGPLWISGSHCIPHSKLLHERGALIICRSNTAALCLGRFIMARGLGKIVILPWAAKENILDGTLGALRGCTGLDGGTLANTRLSSTWEASISKESNSEPSSGDFPLRLTIATNSKQALPRLGEPGYGIVLMPEAPETEQELLQAAAACGNYVKGGGLVAPPIIMLFAAEMPSPECPISMCSVGAPHAKTVARRESLTRFELHLLLQRIKLLRGIGGPMTSRPGGKQVASASALTSPKRMPGVWVPATGAFVPYPLAWSLLQHVLAQGYQEAACRAFRQARGPQAEACFMLGPLRARREQKGPPTIELPPLKGFRENAIMPEVLELEPSSFEGTPGGALSWRESWEALAVKALQRLHSLGVLSNNLLLKPDASTQAEENASESSAMYEARLYSTGDRMWRLLPKCLLAPEVLNQMLKDPESYADAVCS
ncbi:hypothetical protein cyc_01515 [Cyclospora cayetanensis]|uniref:Uncharacterized protein n=1 Tax=Cyclospora cayetanensis TaxID=88456 RepID=A0A1D3D6X9_9EIME|nr:hypothetical protein cyc_01515 [Cyclospora cayetanensis]